MKQKKRKKFKLEVCIIKNIFEWLAIIFNVLLLDVHIKLNYKDNNWEQMRWIFLFFSLWSEQFNLFSKTR